MSLKLTLFLYRKHPRQFHFMKSILLVVGRIIFSLAFSQSWTQCSRSALSLFHPLFHFFTMPFGGSPYREPINMHLPKQGWWPLFRNARKSTLLSWRGDGSASITLAYRRSEASVGSPCASDAGRRPYIRCTRRCFSPNPTSFLTPRTCSRQGACGIPTPTPMRRAVPGTG